MRLRQFRLFLIIVFGMMPPFSAAAQSAENKQPYISVNWSNSGDDVQAKPPPLRSVRPGSKSDSWFPESEYPAEALAKQLEGSAVLDVNIDAAGKITGCTVVTSKGDPILYRNACQTVNERGRFLAELDYKGLAVAATVRLNIYWNIHDPNTLAKAPAMDQTRRVDYQLSDPNHWRPAANSRFASLTPIAWAQYYPSVAGLPKKASTNVDIIMQPDGQISDCIVREASQSPALDQAGCNAIRAATAGFEYGPPTSETKVAATIRWNGKTAELDLADHAKSFGPRLKQTIALTERDRPTGNGPQFAQTFLEMRVGIDGRPKSCSIYRSSHSDDYDRQACALMQERAVFEPARDTLGRPTYGLTQVILDWSKLSAYWPTDYSASFDEEVLACQMGQAASCTTAGNARLGGFWGRRNEKIDLDPAQGIALLKTGCQANATAACRSLGQTFRSGKHTPASPTFAAYYLEMACKGPEGYQDDGACVAHAEMLMNGEGIAADPVRAFKLFEGTCIGWRDQGCLGLGMAYENGTGIAADVQKAIEIYSANCQKYRTTTCLSLEKLYFTGKGVTQDQPRAVAYFEKSCRSGPMSKKGAEACLLSGIAFLDGSGVVANARQAANYLNAACVSGLADGCAHLGNVVRQGLLGKADESVSIRLWKQALAIEPGNVIAQEAMRKHNLDPERD